MSRYTRKALNSIYIYFFFLESSNYDLYHNLYHLYQYQRYIKSDVD